MYENDPYSQGISTDHCLTKTPMGKNIIIATDLFQLNGSTYLLVRRSQHPEIIKLNSITSKAVISSLKSIFFHHSIPSIPMSDNGSQFDSGDIKQFASVYGFQHIMSSPHYPQSNRLAARTVKTIKPLLKNTSDSY